MRRRISDFLGVVWCLAIVVAMAVVVGSASAFFLWGLDRVTLVRFEHFWLLYFLPLVGWLTGWIYRKYGKNAGRGNSLLLEEIHEPREGVPGRMVPLVLFGTWLTHLCGGSAGREGTALQMGGGIAAGFARWGKMDGEWTRLMLTAGIAAGFGSVFGTPIAGAVFALEVLVIGRMHYEALVPCFLAAVVADWTCHAWGAHHTAYVVEVVPKFDGWLLGKVVVGGVVVGLVGRGFVGCMGAMSRLFQRLSGRAEWQAVIGGCFVIGLAWIAGDDYLGLGVLGKSEDAITLPAMFHSMEIPASAWIWKFVFTVVTLSAGFKGGEVTPLFFIGAALGNALAHVLGAPVDLFAALGFVALFGAATNAPVASIILGMELFGAGHGIYLASACVVAYCFGGPSGIYSGQRQGLGKSGLLPRRQARIE